MVHAEEDIQGFVQVAAAAAVVAAVVVAVHAAVGGPGVLGGGPALDPGFLHNT